MTTDELVGLLGSDEMQRRIEALIWADLRAAAAAPALVAVLRHLDPNAWFDEDGTVAAAARTAIDALEKSATRSGR